MPRLATEIGSKRFYRCPLHPDELYIGVTSALKLGSERYYPSGAGNHGTAMHSAFERIVSGTDWRDTDGDLTDLMVPGLIWLETWWRDAQTYFGFEVELVERSLLHHDQRYGGTLDVLLRDRDGLRYVVDLKTQREADHAQWRLQMAAYAMAQEWADDDEVLHPFPAGITNGLVLWVPKSGTSLAIRFDIGSTTKDAWLAVLAADRLLADSPNGETLNIYAQRENVA